MEITQLSSLYVGSFVLLSARMGTALFTMPILNSRSIPAMLKIGLTVMLTFILMPVQSRLPVLPPNIAAVVFLLAQEVLIGLLIGFAVGAIFAGLQMAGQLVGIQTGLNVAAVMDPVSAGGQSSYVDQIYALIAALVFLTMDGHHSVILALRASLDILPIGLFNATEALQASLVTLTATLIAVSLQIALPIIGTLLVTDLAFLLLGKMAPQMNLFMAAGPLKIALGFLVFLLALPNTMSINVRVFDSIPGLITSMLTAAR